jgi:imidazolonepropionase-like amidohydrolase
VLASPGLSGIEHAEAFLPSFADGRSVEGLDDRARQVAARGVVVSSTLVVHASALAQAQSWSAVKARPEMKYLNPATAVTWGWEATGAGRNGSTATADRHFRTTEWFSRSLIPALMRAGVPLVAGSDAPIPAIVPGFGLHDELALLQRAGLSPLEVLRTATTNTAMLVGASVDLGPLAPGRFADLLVLNSNPLDDVGALRGRQGVVVRGRWLSQAGLQRRIDSLATRYASQR